MIRIEFKPGNKGDQKLVDKMIDAIIAHPLVTSYTWKEDDEIIEITLLD